MMLYESTKRPLKVFITYSHKNRVEKDKLITQLAYLKSAGVITIWHDQDILAGDKWREAIFSNLADSDVLLYLTSSHSLDSDNCNKEFEKALDAEIRVIPILLKRCNWLAHRLSEFQCLPLKGKPIPISNWENENDGWQNVVEGLQKTIFEISKKESRAESMSNTVMIAPELVSVPIIPTALIEKVAAALIGSVISGILSITLKLFLLENGK